LWRQVPPRSRSCCAARAQNYLTRPVRLIVGFPAGGVTDILARLLSPWLSERLGQQFIVEDQPGAGTNLATETVVKTRPDGYTFLMATSTNAINATLYDNLQFHPRYHAGRQHRPYTTRHGGQSIISCQHCP
jgi:tripartite-type tricarboxylate transporter receptor subunit TctC